MSAGAQQFGQPNDQWYYHNARDQVGVIVNGTRFIIQVNMLDEWLIGRAVGAQWTFKKEHKIAYASLPAWFQAGAPQWRQEFARMTRLYRPITAVDTGV